MGRFNSKMDLWVFFFITIALFAGYFGVVSGAASTGRVDSYVNSGDDEFYAVQFANNGYVLAGLSNSSGAGRYDAYLIKTNLCGEIEWNTTFGGSQNDRAYCVMQSSDGGYVFGGSTNSYGLGGSDAWIVKLDSAGSVEWNRTYGGSLADSCWSLLQTGDGGYLALCLTASFGAGNNDVWLVKVDSLGEVEWEQTYGGEKSESVSTLVEAGDGGFVLACSTTSFGSGSSDVWLLKTDAVGNLMWNKTIGGFSVEYANTLIAASDGGYVFAGSTKSVAANSTEVLLVKVDSSGNVEWNQTYGGGLADYCDSLVLDDSGYVLACITQPPVFGDGQFWLLGVDERGEFLWNHTVGVSAHHSQTSLLPVEGGGYVVGSSTRDGFGKRDFMLVQVSLDQTEGFDLSYLILIAVLFAVFVTVVVIWRFLKSTGVEKAANVEVN